MLFPIRTPSIALALALATPLCAQRVQVPVVDGELGGQLVPTWISGAPTLRWTIDSAPGANAASEVTLSAEGDGTRVKIRVSVDAKTGRAEWTILQGEFAANRWFAGLALRMGSSATMTATGQIQVTGGGVIQQGSASGRLVVRVQDASVKDTGGKWTLGGVSFDGDFLFDSAKRVVQSANAFLLGVRTITTNQFGARSLTVSGRLVDAQTAKIEHAAIEIAGGQVAAAPAVVPLSPLRIQLDLTFTHIGLQDISQFLPTAVAEARGLVDGAVHLGWTSATGIEVGTGHIALRKDAPAEVRLAPLPGLITGNLPSDETSPVKFRRGLDQVELGRVPIMADSLEAQYTPTGDSDGRQAFVHLSGHYKDGVAPLDLTVNIRGPIGELLRAYIDSRFQVGTKQ